ncbi:MAG: hypothetical protein O8C61_07725 [Candidatus Methanoperedens sp.]|nr:hypothetical protein [Candidatus Methanoperedens sp.]
MFEKLNIRKNFSRVINIYTGPIVTLLVFLEFWIPERLVNYRASIMAFFFGIFVALIFSLKSNEREADDKSLTEMIHNLAIEMALESKDKTTQQIVEDIRSNIKTRESYMTDMIALENNYTIQINKDMETLHETEELNLQNMLNFQNKDREWKIYNEFPEIENSNNSNFNHIQLLEKINEIIKSLKIRINDNEVSKNEIERSQLYQYWKEVTYRSDIHDFMYEYGFKIPTQLKPQDKINQKVEYERKIRPISIDKGGKFSYQILQPTENFKLNIICPEGIEITNVKTQVYDKYWNVDHEAITNLEKNYNPEIKPGNTSIEWKVPKPKLMNNYEIKVSFRKI